MHEALARVMRDLGRQLLDWRAAGQTEGRQEGTQFKAEADRRAHEFLSMALAAIEPGTPIASEEDPDSLDPDRRPRYWLIDPIDGTASFVGGYDGFVTQAALMDASGPLLAAVYAPVADQLFAARRGAGATCNGVSMARSGGRSGALIDNYPSPRGVALAAQRALGLPHYVESGSLGLKICRVADGTADVFVKDVRVADWDLAPGHLILAEAGGGMTDVFGQDLTYTGDYARHGIAAAATPQLHQQLVAWYAATQGQSKGIGQ